MKFFLNGKSIDSIARELRAGLVYLSFSENFHSFEWSGSIEAGEEKAIPNKMLGKSGQKIVPGSVVILSVSGPNAVSIGTTSWSSEYVYLKNRASESTCTVKAVFLHD